MYTPEAVMLPGKLHALLKDLAFIVMLSKSFRKSVQLAGETNMPFLLLEPSILISNAESHLKDFHIAITKHYFLCFIVSLPVFIKRPRGLLFLYTLYL